MKWYVFLPLLLCTTACNEENTNTQASETSANCRGEWTEKNEAGLVIKRYEEYWHSGMKACVTENRTLSQWEKSILKRYNHNVQCSPQPDLPTMWLRSSNNYYTYRNNRVYLHLNSSTGEAARLIIGEMPNGKTSYSRQVFCYFVREDIETEPVNSYDYGAMILFDLEEGASTSVLHPMEIYNFTETPTDFLLTKMDDNTGVDWTWCPTGTPIGFCDYMRNGNEFFYPPAPDAATQAQLQAAAILIRSEMNFIKISENEFNQKWNSIVGVELEVGTWDFIEAGALWKYLVTEQFDEPLFIGRAWRRYLRGEDPFMPDVQWASNFQVPFICYNTKKEVIINNGSSAWIDGEACFVDGQWEFTE